MEMTNDEIRMSNQWRMTGALRISNSGLRIWETGAAFDPQSATPNPQCMWVRRPTNMPCGLPDQPLAAQEIDGIRDRSDRAVDVALGVRCGKHRSPAEEIDASHKGRRAKGVRQPGVDFSIELVKRVVAGNEVI
jgi:hypothetical protein